MRVRRSTILLVCAFTVLASGALGLIIRQARGHDVDSTIWLNALLVLIGVLILTRVSLGPAAQVVPDRCLRCGAATFETARSQDRRHVRTCFSCGHEVVPGEPVREGAEAAAPDDPATDPQAQNLSAASDRRFG